MSRYAERIAALEEQVKGVKTDVTEIKGDVKTLVAHHHAQKGRASVFAMLWAGLGGLVATFASWLLSKF